MKSFIKNNVVNANVFVMTGKDMLSPVVALRDVRYVYKTDSAGKRTDEIQAIKYDVIDTETFSTFTIKVDGSVAVITPNDLELAPDIVYLDIPINQVIIKPYEMSFGNAKVSISAPSVSIHHD